VSLSKTRAATGRLSCLARARLVAVLLAVLPCSAFLPSTARADPFHAQTLPLGQRAIGMGGAFTAVADDPSATFYNPAGLVLTNDSSLSASLTLTAFDRVTVEAGYRTRDGNSSLDHNTGASLPVFVSAIKTLGARGDDGRRRHALALSSFTRNARRSSFDVEARGPASAPGSLETLSINAADRTVWYGLSYAYRVSSKLSLGLSNFISILRSSYVEERISAELGDVRPEGMYSSSASSWTTSRVRSTVKSLVWRLGALYAFDDRLQLGLMFQPPSLHLRGEASVRTRLLQTDLTTMPGVSSILNVSESKLTSHDPTPWEVRLGGRYELYDWLTIALDGSLYGPTGTKSDPVVAIGPRSPDPETGAVAEPGAFISERWYRSFNGNVSLGASASLPQTVTIRAGVYTDLSSAPRVPKYSATYTPPDVHRVGGALSVGLRNEGFDLAIGAIGVFGVGNGLSFSSDPDAGSYTYARTRVTDRMFLVFLNGVKSAISTLAKKADEKLKEIVAERKKEDADLEPKLEPRKNDPE
jgi:long-subunit fatty acid transport protein